MFVDFLDFFHPPLLVYYSHACTSFFQKIPPSKFIDFATFAPPPRLFQPPWLLEMRVITSKTGKTKVLLPTFSKYPIFNYYFYRGAFEIGALICRIALDFKHQTFL